MQSDHTHTRVDSELSLLRASGDSRRSLREPARSCRYRLVYGLTVRASVQALKMAWVSYSFLTVSAMKHVGSSRGRRTGPIFLEDFVRRVEEETNKRQRRSLLTKL